MQEGPPGSAGHGASIADVILYLVGVVGMAACLTMIFLSMRAVMDIGGACADGGPFVPVRSCPDGVALLLVGSIFGLFVFGGLMAYKGLTLGGPFAWLVALAWPALFLSLGLNFLEYAARPPDGSGGFIWGWLIPGIMFVLMGGGPLLLAIRSGGSVGPALVGRVRATSLTIADDRASAGAQATDGLASGLERLARLHDSGELSDVQYEDAKSALIRETASGR